MNQMTTIRTVARVIAVLPPGAKFTMVSGDVTRSPARFFNDFGITLAAVSGDNQTGTVTKALPQPLVVRVLDGSGSPKSGVAIDFSISAAPAGAAGQTLSVSSAATLADGTASTTLTLGNRVGTYTVTAACAGCAPNTITFTAQGKVFLQVSLSTSSIKPVPFSRVVTAENQAAITVRAFGVNGSADTVAGYPVVLISSTSVNSGGHDHDGTRPLGGAFSGAGLAVANNAVSGLTNVQGELFAVFTSTFFGGIEVFTAGSTIDAGVATATAALTIKAGEFQLLPDNPLVYSKVGGTQFHLGPPSSITDHNHFGTPEFNAIISSVSAQFHTAFPGTGIRINDMSLPFGGLFDIGPTPTCRFRGQPCEIWDIPHQFHRLGTSCDYNLSTRLDKDLDTDEERFLDDLIKRDERLLSFIEGNHWHLYFPGGGPPK